MNDAGIKNDSPITVNHGGNAISPPRDSDFLDPISLVGGGVTFDPPLRPESADEMGSIMPAPLLEQLSDIEAFESVGCQRFDLSLTSGSKESRGYFSNMSADQFKKKLVEVFDRAEQDSLNTIIRPQVDDVLPLARIIQLDDLDETRIKQISRLAFRVTETSPGNYQAFIAGDFDRA